MSDKVLINNDFVFHAPKEQNITKKTVNTNGFQGKTLFAIIFASVLLVVSLIIIMMVSSSTVTVSGTVALSKQEILDIAGITETHNLLSVNLKKVIDALESHYKIKTASAQIKLLNKLHIEIEERMPVGIIIIDTMKKGYDFVCVDSEGLLIGYEHEYSKLGTLPLICGIVLKNYKLGNRLDARFIPVLQGIETLKNGNRKLFDEISEFRLEEKTNGYLEVIVYPVAYHTAMRMGTTIDASVLQIGIWMLDALKDKVGTLELKELDLRGKVYSIQFKEAVSG